MTSLESQIQVAIFKPFRMRAILKIIKKLPKGHLADIGCMNDWLLKRLPKGFKYTGFDADPQIKDSRIKKYKMEDIPTNKKYDIVLCTEVLEHLDDPVRGMRKLKELSKKYVLISVPFEPFFGLFRLFLPAKEHPWTIYPWAFPRHLGKPIFQQRACFNRTYIALFDITKLKKSK